MSVEELCKGDVVVVHNETAATGASFGVAETYADGVGYDCNVQVPQPKQFSAESLKYANRGMRLDYWVFFSQDVGLGVNKRLKWTVKVGNALATPKLLRVLDYYAEGRPGEEMLWIADCMYDETNQEA